MARDDLKCRLILARHGETEANVRRCFARSGEVPLTEAGREQSHRLALRLAREFRPEFVLTSEFLRARQTGEIVAGELGLVARAVSGLQERDFGALKGRPHEDLGRMMEGDPVYDPERYQDWAPPGGESLNEVRIRVMHALENVIVRYAGKEIIAIAHGAVIQAVCAHLTGAWTEASVPCNCGIVVVAYDRRGLSGIVPERI